MNKIDRISWNNVDYTVVDSLSALSLFKAEFIGYLHLQGTRYKKYLAPRMCILFPCFTGGNK